MSRRVMLIAATCAAVVGAMAATASAQSLASAGERFVLSGVVFVEGGRGLAWLQEPTLTRNQVVEVRPGDSIGPYRLTKVLEDQVELEGPGGKFSVPLAGSPASASAAASGGMQVPVPGAMQTPAVEQPHPALGNPDAIVISRDDPRRMFPLASLTASQGSDPQAPALRQAPAPEAASGAMDAPVTGVIETPVVDLPPHPALGNPNAVVIPRGDPRRNFPAALILPGR